MAGRKRLDQVDAMHPIKQPGVVSTPRAAEADQGHHGLVIAVAAVTQPGICILTHWHLLLPRC